MCDTVSVKQTTMPLSREYHIAGLFVGETFSELFENGKKNHA